MSWAEKELAKRKLEKEIERAMESYKFKQAQKERDIELTRNAIMNFVLVACGYLEVKHGYKQKGMRTFIRYVKDNLIDIGKDEDILEVQKKYFLTEYCIDIDKEFEV